MITETQAHLALADFLRRFSERVPGLAYVWHTANESAGGAKTVRGVPLDVLKEARMGAVAGVWDWLKIGCACGPFAGLAIELKSDREYRTRSHGLSAAQIVWQAEYIRHNWACSVFPASAWHDAALLLVEWSGGDRRDFVFADALARGAGRAR